MNRAVPPPIGYFVSDYEKEIREICSFLEDEGMQYSLVSDFQIRYSSENILIDIVFERYGDTVCLSYYFPCENVSVPAELDSEGYSVPWTLYEYKKGALKKKYIRDEMTKLELISGYMRFFKDYRVLLLDKNFAEKTKAIYNKVEL